jgi:hypothetical protein
MYLTLDTRLQTHPDVIVTELSGSDGKPEAVLLNLTTHKYFSLNATGIDIWKVLQQGLPLSAAVAQLTERYDVTAAHAEQSVMELAAALAEAELVSDGGQGG